MPDDLKLFLELTARDNLSPEIRRALASVKDLSANVAAVNGVATSDPGHTLAERLGVDATSATQSMNQLAQSIQNVLGMGGGSSGLGSLLSGLSGGWLALGVGATVAAGGLGAMLKNSMDLNAQLETSTVSFQAITHDATLAAEMIKQLRHEADVTPFATQEVIRAGQALVSSAAGSTEQLLRLVRTAEVLASLKPEQGLEGAAFALREATAGQFFSLTSRFEIPLNTVNKLKTEGLSGLNLVDEALKRMGVDYGLVTAQGDTFTGQMSTLQSTLAELERRGGAGIFLVMRDQVKEFSKALQDANSDLSRTADLTGGALGAAASVGVFVAKGIIGPWVGALSLLDQGILLADRTATRLSALFNAPLTSYWGPGESASLQASRQNADTQRYIAQLESMRRAQASAAMSLTALGTAPVLGQAGIQGDSFGNAWQQALQQYDLAALRAALASIQVEVNGVVMASGQVAAGLGQPFNDAAKDIEIARMRVTDLDAAINELGTRRGRLKGFLGDINEAIKVYKRAGVPVPQELLDAKAGIRGDLPTLLLQQVGDELKALRTDSTLKTLVSQQLDVQAQTVVINGTTTAAFVGATSPAVGGHAVGTPYVQRDGLDYLHAGERVLNRHEAQALARRDRWRRGTSGDVHANDQRTITNQVTVHGSTNPARDAAETVARLNERYEGARGIPIRLVGVGG